MQNVQAFAPSSSSLTFLQSTADAKTSSTTTPTTTTSNTKLFGLIAADVEEEENDMKQGGVGLAQDCAILILGNVDKNGMPTATEMKRYNKVSSASSLSDGATVLCKGSGDELYQDPGLGIDKTIILAPLDAVEKALVSIENKSSSSGKISINFTGGDDLMLHEVLEAVQNLVSGMDLYKNKVEFRSLCHTSFPMEKCSVAALQLSDDSGASSDTYWHEGQWWNLSEDELNTNQE